MKKILCLSGWGQKYNSLEYIFSDEIFTDISVSSLDYSSLKSVEDFFLSLKNNSQNPEIVIGWSLGGQLAVRAIEKNLLQPKFLILIAPPFQMIKDERVQAGMAPKTFQEFYDNFKKAPNSVLKQFAILTAMNDKNSSQIAKNLDINNQNHEQLIFWLEELRRFSCFDVDFSKMPKTLYFHGAGDMIVHSSQMYYFKNTIKNFQCEILKNCGHAPHLNDINFVREKILQFIF